MDSFKPESVTYEILERVGEGLTSTVYKALRLDSRGHSRQLVALKVLEDETTIPILRREFETLARVRSPHCVRVLAWENSGGRPALVLEWIEGVTLDRLGWSPSAEEIDDIAKQIAKGLADLADVGLHHGDLHPRNVLVDVDGVVRLVDFGTGDSDGGSIRGAPAYLAPEIWQGVETSLLSDLFALGAMLFDLRTNFAGVGKARRDSSLVRIGDPLLDPEPSSRRFPEESPVSPEARARVGERVRRALADKRPPMITEVLPMTTAPQKWAAPVAASILAALTTLSIPVRAEAPLEIATGQATIEFRSNRWLEVEINGKSAGFSPLRITNLRPGYHRLKWRGGGGSGEARLQFVSGGVSRFDEDDLAKLTTDLKR